MKLFFATDLQGSDICFRKLLNAGSFYGAETIIMGGDLTGKMVVPVVRQQGQSYLADFQGSKVSLETEGEMQRFNQKLRDMGYYPYLTDVEELSALGKDRERADSVFRQLMVERIRAWVELADTKLRGQRMKFFFILGNDDDYCIDEVLATSQHMVNLDGNIANLDEGYEILGVSGSNPTPWHTPREFAEHEIKFKICEVAERVENMQQCVFNIHVPPFDSKIDEVAELDEDFRVVTEVGYARKKPAGSKSVRWAIENYQPMLGLFGHIHEGRGYIKIGRTLCVNPGSNYTEGVLNGCLVTLAKGKVKDFQLTIG